MRKVKRIYHHISKWECIEAGMYADSNADGKTADQCRQMYAEFLSDIPRFRRAIHRVFNLWPRSCEHFLTNPDHNRVAWIGQAAMCMETKVSSRHKSGFMLLTKQQQQAANIEAELQLWRWLNENEKNDKGVHKQLEIKGL